MYKVLSSIKPILSRYKYFFFDCDGVLWHGGKELFNAFQALKFLQAQNKQIFLLTNNSTQSRASGSEYVKSKFGFTIDPNRFCSTTFLAGHYAKSKGYKNLYVIGAKPLFDELKLNNSAAVLYGATDTLKSGLDDEFYQRAKSVKIDAVVVGKDDKLNYYKMAYAVCAITQGADLIATHEDLTFRSQGVIIPNTGATVKAIEAATRKKAINLGKPEDYGIKVICENFNIDFKKERENMIIIGDNLGVEILLGNKQRIDSLLVLSGSTTQESLEKELDRHKGTMPTYVIPHLTYKLF